MTHADWLISGPEKVILPFQKVYEKPQANFPVQTSHSVNKSLIYIVTRL